MVITNYPVSVYSKQTNITSSKQIKVLQINGDNESTMWKYTRGTLTYTFNS